MQPVGILPNLFSLMSRFHMGWLSRIQRGCSLLQGPLPKHCACSQQHRPMAGLSLKRSINSAELLVWSSTLATPRGVDHQSGRLRVHSSYGHKRSIFLRRPLYFFMTVRVADLLLFRIRLRFLEALHRRQMVWFWRALQRRLVVLSYAVCRHMVGDVDFSNAARARSRTPRPSPVPLVRVVLSLVVLVAVDF